MSHEHYWHYLHCVYEGRHNNEASIVRYCRCGARQRAFAARWSKLPKDHDAHGLIDSGDDMPRATP